MGSTTPFFTNPDTEAKYEPCFGMDKVITLPGDYSGKLSGISPEQAQKLIDMGDNQVKARKKPLAPAGSGSTTDK